MKVFLSGTSFHPAYGGPAYSVSRLAVALSEAGAQVGLWSPDQSAVFTNLVADGSCVQRLHGTAAEALADFGACDVVHDNGIWWPHNHQLAVLARSHGVPRVVSTRGMLEPWCVRHKRMKKKIGWWLYQQRDLRHAAAHHATSDMEAARLHDHGLEVPIQVIPNGVDVPPIHHVIGARRRRIALFVGRIYPVKGLPMLIEAWSRVRPAGWALRIAGPDEAGHRKEVQRAICASGLDDTIRMEGRLDGAEKRAAMLAAELFVLPTHSESFGMAIGEALAHGLPVLTTTAAPWASLVAHECGWRVAPNVEDLTEAIRHATSLDPDVLRAMGERGRDLVAREFGWHNIASRFLAMYRTVISNAKQTCARSVVLSC